MARAYQVVSRDEIDVPLVWRKRTMPSSKKSPYELALTRDTGRLDLAQRIFYERNGYLLLPRLVPMDVLERCSQRFDDIVAGRVDKGEITVMRDVRDRAAVNKIQDLHQDEVFLQYFGHERILDVVEAFVGPNIMAMHSMLIAKPPDAGYKTSKHPPHQDLYYFPFRPADRVVAAWTAIEICDKQNGCLFVSPGSHVVGGLRAHNYPPGTKPGAINKAYHGIQDLPESTMPWLDLEMQPGDTVFFHPLLIHGSGVNESTRTRKAISCHYAAAECHYIEVKGTIQEGIADEVLQVQRRRYPDITDMRYVDVWRFKATLLRGVRSTL